MKYLFLLCLLASCGLVLRAQDDSDSDQQKQPQEEIPDFSNVEDYIYVPKSTVYLGMRYISAPKVKFWGNGTLTVPTGQDAGDATTPNVLRTYNDGSVGIDTRTVTVDNGNGTTSAIPLNGSDGKTNTWSYDSSNQVTSDGYMAFNIYSAQTDSSQVQSLNGKSGLGMELVLSHDMGKLGKHFSWNVFEGMSINDIDAASTGPIQANVTALTDTYDLYGVTPAAPPYTSPSSTTINVVDSSGNQVTDTNGNGETQTVDTSTLISNTPLNRTITTTPSDTEVVNNWKVHGAYFTVRFGPELVYSIGDHFQVSVSVGPAILYAGSNYTVNQTLQAPTGDPIVEDITDNESKVLFGYYGDATVQYNITDRAGLYLGSYFQTAQGYNQKINNPDGVYDTHVDLSDQNGFRTGMSIKF